MNRKGFTLIELLIVIAILGILVALILPRFSDVRTDANTKVCVANIRGLVAAMNTYEIQYNSNPAWGTDAGFITVTDMTALGLLASDVDCPDPAGAYTLTNVTDPGATCAVGGTHVWP